MPNDRLCEIESGSFNNNPIHIGNLHFYNSVILFALIFLTPKVAISQQSPVVPASPLASSSRETVPAPANGFVTMPKQTSDHRSQDPEVSIMGMIPDGDYRLFSATVRCNVWTVGVEYDLAFPGTFLKARADYATEILPVVLLSQPDVSDFWGNGLGPNQRLVPGLSILPIGFRFRWRGNNAVRPYVVGKLGAIVFARKALSQAASNANFNIQAAFGIQMRLTERLDLRVEPFEFFHVSNGYMAASNPGMDELATRFGVTYHLRKKVQER